MNIVTHEINHHDIATAADLHARRSKVGLHSVLGPSVLKVFYEELVSNPDLKVLIAKIDDHIVGLGYLVLNQKYLKNIFRRRYGVFIFKAIAKIPNFLLAPQRTFGAFRAVFSGGASGAKIEPPPESVELGFIVTDQVKSIPASAISKAIFLSLVKHAKNLGYKRMFSVVSAGHHASILMHSILGFKQYSSNGRFNYYSRELDDISLQN